MANKKLIAISYVSIFLAIYLGSIAYSIYPLVFKNNKNITNNNNTYKNLYIMSIQNSVSSMNLSTTSMVSLFVVLLIIIIIFIIMGSFATFKGI